MSALRGPRQRRPTIPVIFGVHVSALLEQQPHERLIPLLGSPRQRRPAVSVLAVHVNVGPLLQQQLSPPCARSRPSVQPYFGTEPIYAAFSISSRIIASCPFFAATDSGVWLSS